MKKLITVVALVAFVAFGLFATEHVDTDTLTVNLAVQEDLSCHWVGTAVGEYVYKTFTWTGDYADKTSLDLGTLESYDSKEGTVYAAFKSNKALTSVTVSVSDAAAGDNISVFIGKATNPTTTTDLVFTDDTVTSSAARVVSLPVYVKAVTDGAVAAASKTVATLTMTIAAN